MKKKIIIFLLLFSVTYSKFEKQFNLTNYENETWIKSYVTKEENLSISILDLKEANKKFEASNKMTYTQVFETFAEGTEGRILESTNNMILFEVNKKFNGKHLLMILKNNKIYYLEGNINQFNKGLQYLRLNKEISEIEEHRYNVLIVSGNIKKDY